MVKYKIYRIDTDHLAKAPPDYPYDDHLNRVCLIEIDEYTLFTSMEDAIEGIKQSSTDYNDDVCPDGREYAIIPVFLNN